jgi:hypothetical protein
MLLGAFDGCRQTGREVLAGHCIGNDDPVKHWTPP